MALCRLDRHAAEVRKLECLDLKKRDAWQLLPDMEECRTQMAFIAVASQKICPLARLF